MVNKIVLVLGFGFVGLCSATKTAEELKAEIQQIKERKEEAIRIHLRLAIFNQDDFLSRDKEDLVALKQGIATNGSVERYMCVNEESKQALDLLLEIQRKMLDELGKEAEYLRALEVEKGKENLQNFLNSSEKKDDAQKAYDAYLATDEGRKASAAEDKYKETEAKIAGLVREANLYEYNIEFANKYKDALLCLQELHIDEAKANDELKKYKQVELDLHQEICELQKELEKIEQSAENSSARRPLGTRMTREVSSDGSVAMSFSDFDRCEESPLVSDQRFDNSDEFDSFEDGIESQSGNRKQSSEKSSQSSNTKWIVGGSVVTVAAIAGIIAVKKYYDERKKEEEKKKKQAVFASAAA